MSLLLLLLPQEVHLRTVCRSDTVDLAFPPHPCTEKKGTKKFSSTSAKWILQKGKNN